LVAEELDCDWNKIVIEYPTPGQSVARKRVWGEFSTGGSRGIRQSNEYVRKGGAAARMMLVQAAANQWKVPASECTASNSVITHTPTKRTVTFGAVAEAAARLEQPKEVPLKDPKSWKVVGQPIKRPGQRGKVNGKTVYGMDIKLPGMLNAAIRECPVFGGKLKSFDANKIAGMKGVKKVVAGGRQRSRGRSRHLVAGEGRARRIADRLGRRPQREDVERRRSQKTSRPGWTRIRPSSATRTETSRLPFRAPRRKSRPVYAYPFQNHACMER
jgi:isoquinoline 1-oxidoreductase beta subunit